MLMQKMCRMSSVSIFVPELKTLKEKGSVSEAGVSVVDLEFCPR